MEEIQKIRKQIDDIDLQISNLLKKRRENVEKLREIQEEAKMGVIDEKREKEILDKFETKFEKEIFKKIIEECRKIQQ